MKINFISNYINHHQIPFCDCLYRKLGEGFYVYTDGAYGGGTGKNGLGGGRPVDSLCASAL